MSVRYTSELTATQATRVTQLQEEDAPARLTEHWFTLAFSGVSGVAVVAKHRI